MTGFLYPLLGLAAFAALVPILLHLFRRHDVRRIDFPAIRYLRRAEQRHARRLRVRHLLLLATRVTMILLVALAAAGPLVGRGDASDHQPTAVAIVVDESLSSDRLTGDTSLLEQFRERVEQTLDLATAADMVALFSAVNPQEGPVSQGVAGTRSYLGSLHPVAAVADLRSALLQARAWLRSYDDRAREIHILSDRQAVSLGSGQPSVEEEPASEGRLDSRISVVAFTPDLPQQPNGAPGEVQPEVNPLSLGQATRLAVPLLWFGEQVPDDPVVARLVSGESVVDLSEARFAESVVLTLPPRDSGWTQGYVEIDDRGLASDDRRYFSWRVQPAVSAATLGDPGPFLRHALETLELGGRLRISEPERAEVWLSVGAQGAEEAASSGRAIVVIPSSDPLDLPRANSRLARAGIPWRYTLEEAGRGASRITGDVFVQGVVGLEVQSPQRLIPERSGASDAVLLRLSSGEPWLVRGRARGGAAYVLLATPLSADASTLPVSAAMVPFLDALVGVWSRSGSLEESAIQGGSPIRLPPQARTVRLPDGSARSVEGGAWFLAREHGNYIVEGGDRTLHAFSVNAPLEESDLSQASVEQLEAALPEARWWWVRGGDLSAWRDAIYRARRGRHAWRPLVVALLLVSIVEASLAAAGRRRTAGPPREVRPD